MDEKSDKWTRAIAKLIEKTQRGRMVWRLVESSDPEMKDVQDGGRTVFITEDGDRILRIYEHQYQKMISSISISARLSQAQDSQSGRYVTRSEVILEFVNRNWTPIFRFPETEGLSDLLFTIKYRTSGAQEYLDQLLAEDY